MIIKRNTRSVCPVCLKNIPARLIQLDDDIIYMEKQCSDHGSFSVPIWHNAVDFDDWILGSNTLDDKGQCCPVNCGLCPEHEVESCCVLLEVSKRCNLHCKYCFANGGVQQEDLSTEEIKKCIKDIAAKCGGIMLQFSGGEPSLREDLPELIAYAKQTSCKYVQINTNGIRLAEDPEYTKALAEAGLDIAFLQFDGTSDDIYFALRGKALFDIKKRAIEICSENNIGITLVPTLVKGINTDNIGDIVRFAASNSPKVRAVHFQPVSYFGRYPTIPQAEDRYTLDQLIFDISNQTGVPISSFMPSRCDHPLCGFHSSFIIDKKNKQLTPLSSITHSSRNQGSASVNREYVAKHWCKQAEEKAPAAAFSDNMDFDTFLYYVRHESLSISAMAFQDAMNLNIERLHRCSLHVYDNGAIKPFCAKYISSF